MAAFLRYFCREVIVSADFVELRVVGIRTRWEDGEREAKNSSMRRWQNPRPIPLDDVREFY